MDGAKTCCEIGSKINRLLDDRTEQLSALCVGRHKAQITLQQKNKKPFTAFHKLSAVGVFTPHWTPNGKCLFSFTSFFLRFSLETTAESSPLWFHCVLELFRAHLHAVLLKKYLPGLGSFLRALKWAHSYFREPLRFLEEQTGKSGFYWLATCSHLF